MWVYSETPIDEVKESLKNLRKDLELLERNEPEPEHKIEHEYYYDEVENLKSGISVAEEIIRKK